MGFLVLTQSDLTSVPLDFSGALYKEAFTFLKPTSAQLF